MAVSRRLERARRLRLAEWVALGILSTTTQLSCCAFHVHSTPTLTQALRGGGETYHSTSSARSPLFRSATAASIVETGGEDKKSAIVVGGGPVGLAAALMLASEPHFYDVKVLEATTGDMATAKYDATKAYLYNVNLRGQTWTRSFPAVQAKLHNRGVAAGPTAPSGIMIVPSDPAQALPPFAAMGIGNAPKPGDKPVVQDDGKNSYWIPRHAMVQLLLEEAQATPGIEFCGGQACEAVLPSNKGNSNSNKMQVTTRDAVSGETKQFEADLVVGADGMNSKVREYLAKDPNHMLQDEFQDYHPRKFRVKQWISPSSNLRIKVLQFPPQFDIPNVNETTHVTSSESVYAIRSIFNAPKTYLSLGLLPMKDNTQVRPTNIVTRPDHVVWTLTDGPSIRAWFETAFPRMPFKEGNSMISDEEWDRFAKAEGTRFPPCQHSCGMQISHKDRGVVLVGDAMHAYPPDIGQGVNSGLLDVVALDRALRGVEIVTGRAAKDASSPPPDLSTALRKYEKNRIPEVKALIRLARFGAPYQYRQPHRIDRFRQTLWTANVALRLLLNKVTFGLVPKAAIMLATDTKLVSFRQVMRRADLTTAGITMASLGMILRCFFWTSLTTFFRPTP